ncbi:MAG: ArnT family glycosyltransferase, partial [Nitrospiraceae bacterium]
MNNRSHPVILLSLAALLFFLGLGALGLTDRDEGSNAEAAREMVETGDWITPTLNYEPRFAKPAFVYWLMSGAYRLVGVSEFAARLPSALFGVALILLQYLFLTRMRGPVLGLLGALMLLLNIGMVSIGRLALTDSVLIFFTTLALFSFWLGLHLEGRARHFFWLFYLGMALATLTKGPVGVAVPLLAVVPYLTVTRRWGQFWQRGFPLSGALLFLLLALPWYAAMFTLHGSRYTASAQADT